MPSKSYRFFDPLHQTADQSILQNNNNNLETEDENTPWFRSTQRREFDAAQASCQDMKHIIADPSWVIHDLSQAIPIQSLYQRFILVKLD